MNLFATEYNYNWLFNSPKELNRQERVKGLKKIKKGKKKK